jgi:hypothetical protein
MLNAAPHLAILIRALQLNQRQVLNNLTPKFQKLAVLKGAGVISIIVEEKLD